MATALYPYSIQKQHSEEHASDHSTRYIATENKSLLLQCTLCEEIQTSKDALSRHIEICGNKTDECPKCRKLIRRNRFIYHYENNCADQNETDKSTLQLEKKNSSVTMECELCHDQFASADYKTHKENCRHNRKLRQTRARSAVSERRSSDNIVRIPCEICNEPVDLTTWSAHVQDCRETQNRRIQAHPQQVNREQIERKSSPRRLETDQTAYVKNPERRTSRSDKSNNSYSTLSSTNPSHQILSKDTMQRTSEHFSSHTTNKNHGNFEKLHTSNVSSLPIRRPSSVEPRRMSNDSNAQLINSSKNTSTNVTLHKQTTNRPRSTSLDRRRSPMTPHINSASLQSFLNDRRDGRGSLNRKGSKTKDSSAKPVRCAFMNTPDENNEHQPKFGQPDRLGSNKKKSKAPKSLCHPPMKF